MIDEEGQLRIKGKNETDHNTITMELKINDPRKPIYVEKWQLNNTEGWKKFNQKMVEINEKSNLVNAKYEQIERTINKVMEETIGKKRIRIDKTPTVP